MKLGLCAALTAFVISTGAGIAGGLADPVLEQDLIEAETRAASGGDILVPILFLIWGGAVVAG